MAYFYSADKKLMPCLLCDIKYSENDVKELLYFPDTSICYRCYADMKEQRYEVSCFGKPDLILELRGQPTLIAQGYDPNSPECKTEHGLCPDRRYCPLFVTSKILQLRKAVVRSKPVPAVTSSVVRTGHMANGNFCWTPGTNNEKIYTALSSGRPVGREMLNEIVTPAMVVPVINYLKKQGVKIEVIDGGKQFQLIK